MTPTLTDEQVRALADRAGEPLELIDPTSDRKYVLLPSEAYERIRGLLGVDIHPSEAYPAIDRSFAEGWDAPGMDDYDRYEELKR